ncbi:MAG: transposase [Planctomycetaceae bacterium]|nr:transposase [Planctomycetaceae bacterium]
MSSRTGVTGKSLPNTKSSSTGADQGALLKRALQWIVTDNMFADFKQHGNSSWKASSMVILVVLTAWMPSPQLTESFSKATVLSKKLFDVLAIRTYQGMMRALVTNGSNLLSIVCSRIQALMSEVSPEHFRIGGWVPLAVDGSRFSTPRTQSNESAFSARHYGSGTHAKSRRKWKNKSRRSKKIIPIKPQIWLTLIWHMGLKLSWCWKKGASTSSERHHFMEMLKSMEFPAKTLFCGDAGFVGYELWSTIIEQGHHFLMRVGGNVRLLKKLATVRHGDGIVFLWPDTIAQKKQPPLILRLIQVTTTAGTMYLVTNILTEKQLSVQVVRKLYPLRWGIELQFRSAKQTFGLGNLRSRNAEHALVELDWSLVALTMIQLLAIREQVPIDIPPERSSVSEAIKAIRSAIDSWRETEVKSTNFRAKLRQAIRDEYHRTSSKKARYQPSSKEKPSATKPILVNATAKQRARYKALLIAA